MLKRQVCGVAIDLKLQPIDPILIKSGYATVMGPDMAFVRTRRNGREEVFLPGSSLKGVLRGHSERICRTLQTGRVCIPYLGLGGDAAHGADAIRFCGKRFDLMNSKPPSHQVYAQSCPMCRLFGSTHFIGRLAVGDAYAVGNAPQPEPRDGVGIDRYTGGAAKGAKFDLEVVTRGEFLTRIEIQNFEAWQLGLLGLLLGDLEDELVRIGSGKSRGLGRVRGVVDRFTLRYYGGQAPPEFRSLWDFLELDERQAYGVRQPQLPGSLPPLGEPLRRGIRWEYDLTGTYRGLLAALQPAFLADLEASPALPPIQGAGQHA